MAQTQDPNLQKPDDETQPQTIEGDDVLVNGVPRGVLGVPTEPVGLNVAPPTPMPTMSIMDILNSPEYKARLKALQERGQGALDEQKRGLQQNENLLKNAANTNDNSALYNWIDDSTGSHLSRTNVNPLDRAQAMLKLQNMIQGQRKDLSNDEIGFIKSQLSGQFDPLKMQKEMAQIDYYNRYGQGGPVQQLQEQRQDFTEHQKVLGQIDNDKTNLQRLASTTNIGNALGNFANATIKSPAQLEELQQTVRANLGIKGQGGVDEREKAYLHSLDQDITKAKSYWGSDPQNLKSQGIINHIKQLAALEQANFQKQADARMQALIAGHESLYNRNPVLREDLLRKIDSAKQQYVPFLPAPGSTSHPEAEGAQAAQQTTPPGYPQGATQQDMQMIDWAKQNIHNPKAVEILKHWKVGE